jgi:hypothetical protein
VLFLLAFLLILEYLVLPQLAGARRSLHLIADANVWCLIGGLLLEIAAILAYGQLTRVVLPLENRPDGWTVLRINLSTLAASHVVPGGSAAGGSLGFRLLTQESVGGTDAALALATQSVGSAIVLNAVLWLALLVSIPLRGFNPLYVTAVIIGSVLFTSIAAAVLLLTKGEERVTGIVCRVADHVPFVKGDTVARGLHRAADNLRDLADDPHRLRQAIVWATANWLLDAASLWVMVTAFGARPDPIGLLVAFGLANVVAAIPITPGGLGVMEATLTTLLVGFGTPRGTAILGVVAWRLANFWLPIPAGAFAYLSLRLGPGRGRRAKTAALRQAATTVVDEAAARTGPPGDGSRAGPPPDRAGEH